MESEEQAKIAVVTKRRKSEDHIKNLKASWTPEKRERQRIISLDIVRKLAEKKRFRRIKPDGKQQKMDAGNEGSGPSEKVSIPS